MFYLIEVNSKGQSVISPLYANVEYRGKVKVFNFWFGKVKILNYFFNIQGAISRITEPILGLLVLK